MKKPVVIIVTAVLTLLFGFYNTKVEERGVNEEVLTDQTNRSLKEIRWVRGETRFTIPVTFVLEIREGWEKRQLEFLTAAKHELNGTWMSTLR